MTSIDQINAVADRSETIFTATEVDQAYDRMAEEITQRLAESNPLILCTLIGGIIPTGQLLPRLNFPLQIDYLHATRYRGKTTGSELHWLARPSKNLQGRSVLIVDDVLDYGITLEAIIADCHLRGASEVLTAVLVEKQIPDRPGLKQADFTGLIAEDRYLYGQGMDFHDYLRNTREIYAAGDEDV